jgi:hypothetical protein
VVVSLGYRRVLGREGATVRRKGVLGGAVVGLVLVLALGASLLVTGGRAAAASGEHTLTIYTVATAVQYVNNADDEARGMTNNPFDVAMNKLRPQLTWKGDGPFAGDVTVYSFNMFATRSLKGSTGTASFTCYYSYNQQAFCQAYYELEGGRGTLLASGPVNFERTGFTLVVTGGTGTYLGARGEVTESATAKNAQRLDFTLLTV